MEFKDLNINENICEALKKQDITNPTEIQSKLIPSMLDGKDIIAKCIIYQLIRSTQR